MSTMESLLEVGFEGCRARAFIVSSAGVSVGEFRVVVQNIKTK